ncbi:MAG: glycosyltransferase family 4 protein [Bacteroidales bacterium]|nr:glycosyltransferase family 4 protein [Bacteroidales bacterium]
MKKVLIITYYWPPGGGAGVQRWLKFVKYLRDFGWEPVVYTPENPEYPAIDESLQNDIPNGIKVLKRKIREPYSAYKVFVGRKKEDRIKAGFLSEKKNPGLFENISVWVRGNLFIPDARKFWIKPSVRFLNSYLKVNPVDAIVSTGPPHSMHLIALQVARASDIPWIADFRDPWTQIDFYHDLRLSSSADKKHRRLEKEVLASAHRVIVISPSMGREMKKIVNRNYDVITNGYDDSDYEAGKVILDKKFSIAHIGSMVRTRNPETLWKVLSELIEENREFEQEIAIKLIGQVDYSINESIQNNRLENYVTKIDYLSHTEAIAIQQQVQVLLLLVNQTPNARMVLTGKIFEYMGSGRPILCIGPTDGDAAKIIAEAGVGKTVAPNDAAGLKKSILEYFDLYLKGKLSVDGVNIDRFSRRNLTQKLAEVLNELMNKS